MNAPGPDAGLERACGVFTERWMQAYAQSWNAEQAMVQELMRLRFSAVIGYGFLDATTPRGMLVVIRGNAAHAGDYDGRDLDWDLRAAPADWNCWLAQGFSVPDLLMAVAADRLQLRIGDYRRILRKPPLISALLRAFTLMTEVSVVEP